MEQAIVQFAKNIVLNNTLLSYIFFFLSQSLQVLFPPYPGDMILILEGYLSGLVGLNTLLIVANAVTATILSSVLLYNIGWVKEEKILHLKIIHYLFETGKIDKLKKLFKKLGVSVIILSKFIPGIYSLTVLAAGIFKLNKRNSYIAISVISFLHNTAFIMLGKVVGENWSIIFNKINIYNKYISIILIAGVLIYLLLLSLKKKLLE
ncbi:DedA family protein [Brassicibacter mesophilus]|jgi:membrane protein DedA with SNARE-associated domain|uniref:DedA family protein n=1 Tax=Brassicibacter mesophilus TaxID=745119 RepID=UPI003D1E8814